MNQVDTELDLMPIRIRDFPKTMYGAQERSERSSFVAPWEGHETCQYPGCRKTPTFLVILADTWVVMDRAERATEVDLWMRRAPNIARCISPEVNPDNVVKCIKYGSVGHE